MSIAARPLIVAHAAPLVVQFAPFQYAFAGHWTGVRHDPPFQTWPVWHWPELLTTVVTHPPLVSVCPGEQVHGSFKHGRRKSDSAGVFAAGPLQGSPSQILRRKSDSAGFAALSLAADSSPTRGAETILSSAEIFRSGMMRESDSDACGTAVDLSEFRLFETEVDVGFE
jgi:hypothetical protein